MTKEQFNTLLRYEILRDRNLYFNAFFNNLLRDIDDIRRKRIMVSSTDIEMLVRNKIKQERKTLNLNTNLYKDIPSGNHLTYELIYGNPPNAAAYVSHIQSPFTNSNTTLLCNHHS